MSDGLLNICEESLIRKRRLHELEEHIKSNRMDEIYLNDKEDIQELIFSLLRLMDQGYEEVDINKTTVGDGNCDDGSNEFEWTEVKLVGNYKKQ